MRQTRFARLAAATLLLPVAAAATGCSAVKPLLVGEKFEFHCPQPPGAAVAIAAGVRSNSPKPALPAQVRQLVVDAMNGCAKITVIRVDGRPAITGTTVFRSIARTEQNFELEKAEFLKGVSSLIADARAQAPEANVLDALSLAASAAGPGGTVVLLDSGVQTTDPIDLRRDNLPAKKPKAIADALHRHKLLPDLRDRSVVLAGLGYTAAPQEPLDESNRAFLVDLWREVVLAAGAKDPVVLADPNTAASVDGGPAVGVVTFPRGRVVIDCDAVSVLPDDDKVGFVPDQATLRSPDAARAVLQTFAGFLATNPDARIEIEGFVAHYGRGDLSQRRADAVKQMLESLGVRNTISAEGKGWGPYPAPDAPPDPRYDQLNRYVTIRIRC